MIEVDTPDGVAEFPDGTSSDVIKAALSKRYAKTTPAEPTWGDRGREALQGLQGRADEMTLGLRGLLPESVQRAAEARVARNGGLTKETATKIPDTWAGTAGGVGLDVLATALPGGAMVKGAQAVTKGMSMLPRVLSSLGINMGGNAAMSAALTPENRGTAAAFGAAGAALGDAVGGVVRKVAPMVTSSGRQGLRQARAGKVLAGDLGDDALTVAKQLESYRPQVLGHNVPVSTAQAMRQIEGSAPGRASTALAKRQLGVSGVAAEDFAELARRQNETLYDVATTSAGRDAGNLDALTTAREASTAPLRENALDAANRFAAGADTGAAKELGEPLAAQLQQITSRSVPGSPQRGLSDLVSRTLAENPDARQLYELRKLLANKLSGPHMPGDDVAAVVKGAERETRQMMSAIDARLQEASGVDGPGTWAPYMREYRDKSVPVTSARTQGQITEALTPEGGPLVGNAPEVTRHKLAQAVKKFGSDKRGFERLDPAAKARYEELQQFMQRNEEAMRSTKLGGTGGGGSQTTLQSGLGEATPSLVGGIMSVLGYPGAGSGIGLARAGTHALRAETKRELAQLMLDPQRAAKGIQAALAQNKPLSEAQVAFRAFARTQGNAAGAGMARE